MRHLVVTIQKIEGKRLCLKVVSNPFVTRYGATLKKWMSTQSLERQQTFCKQIHIQLPRLNQWINRVKDNTLALEDNVHAFFDGKPLLPMNKRDRESSDPYIWTYDSFPCYVGHVQYEVYMENERVVKIIHAVYVPSIKPSNGFLNFIVRDIKPLTQRRSLKNTLGSIIDWKTLQHSKTQLINSIHTMDREEKQDLLHHLQQAKHILNASTPPLEDVLQQYWRNQNELELMVDLPKEHVDQQLETIRWLREQYWSLYASYPLKESKHVLRALEWGWLIKHQHHITFQFVYDSVQRLKKGLSHATFFLGDPPVLETKQTVILVPHEEIKYEVECRLDDLHAKICTTIPTSCKRLLIYQAHRFTFNDWIRMLDTLTAIPSLHIMGRNDQYGYIFRDMITHHQYIEKPITLCATYEFIYNVQDITAFSVRPSWSCQYMASKSMPVVLTPQRIWLFRPKRLRTISKQLNSNQYRFQETREKTTTVPKIHDASIIAVRDYIGPMLHTIVMVVDAQTKPFDMYMVRTLAQFKVYYIVTSNCCTKEQRTPPTRQLIY